MKRVLFFLESLKGGGAEKVLLDIVKHLPEDEYQIKVMLVTDTMCTHIKEHPDLIAIWGSDVKYSNEEGLFMDQYSTK